MNKAAAESVIGRKVASSHSDREENGLQPERALSLALARAADRTMGLLARVQSGGLRQVSATEVIERLPDPALLGVLDGPGGAIGLAVFDAALVGVLIERQTLGRVGALTPPPRRPTRTDAAMLAGLIDGWLGEVDLLLGPEEASVWAGGFRYASHLGDARPLGLMLDEAAYQMVVCRVTPDGTDRVGEAILVFPRRLPAAPAAASKDGEDETAWQQSLERAVLASDVDVRAVLARVTLPLAHLLAARPGQSLTLPADALRRIQIEGSDGGLLVFASLGQGQGVRAVRMVPQEDGYAPVAPAPEPAELVAETEANDATLFAPAGMGAAGRMAGQGAEARSDATLQGAMQVRGSGGAAPERDLPPGRGADEPSVDAAQATMRA